MELFVLWRILYETPTGVLVFLTTSHTWIGGWKDTYLHSIGNRKLTLPYFGSLISGMMPIGCTAAQNLKVVGIPDY
jgi:hypothetical protein